MTGATKLKEIIIKTMNLPLQISFMRKNNTCIKYLLRTDRKGKGIFLNKKEYE